MAIKQMSNGHWNWLSSEEKADYIITGKYLFFSPDRERLVEIAKKEINEHGFHKAKVNRNLLEGRSEYVLCLYYKDDSRKHELAQRNRQEYGVKYRFWKTDEATLRGQYSEEFLSKLSESDKRRFTLKT